MLGLGSLLAGDGDWAKLGAKLGGKDFLYGAVVPFEFMRISLVL